jgi:TonB family protein
MRNRSRPDPAVYYSLTGVPQELGDEIITPPENVSSASPVVPGEDTTPGLEDGALSPDLSLDLLLHEIAELASFSTGASGVAIALSRAGDLVCRAATGNAPGLDVRLNPYSGLSGLCLQTKAVQRCDDTEVDPRVNVAACRELFVRSIVVVPVVANGSVAGLLEAYSSSPNHFGDHDIEELKRFSKQIADLSREREGLSVAPSPLAAGDLPISQPDGINLRSRSLSHWSLPLTAAVIIMALSLGWFAGRTQKHGAAFTLSPEPSTAEGRTSQNKPAVVAAVEAAAPRQPDTATPAIAKDKGLTDEKINGGLVVYQNGKIIFREPPRSQASPKKAVVTGASRQGSVIPAGKTELIPASDAGNYVVSRVDPLYPESAKRERIEGPVILKVLVGKDGGVQQVQVLNGNPVLASAASDALIRWQFKPLIKQGKAVEFKTEVTVNFRLPQ